MYVTRCYLYIENKRIVQQNFELEWAEQLTYDFKNKLVNVIEAAIPSELLPAADVTTSSQYRDIRDLNIFNVKTGFKNYNFYTFWNEIILKRCPTADDLPGLYSYVYLNRLSREALRVICNYRCFYDIYYNPDKKMNSLARTFIAYQLLVSQNKEDYLQDINKFAYWYLCNMGTLIIKH